MIDQPSWIQVNFSVSLVHVKRGEVDKPENLLPLALQLTLCEYVLISNYMPRSIDELKSDA